MSDAPDVAGRPRLHRVLNWCTLVAARLLVGFPFVIDNGLWPSVFILVGNATLVVSKHIHV
jgi:hypothetical protein